MHVLLFLFWFQQGNLLLYILYFSLLPVFFSFIVSYLIILNLLLFITALYATYHDHGTWFVRLQLSRLFRMKSANVFGDAQQVCDLFQLE